MKKPKEIKEGQIWCYVDGYHKMQEYILTVGEFKEKNNRDEDIYSYSINDKANHEKINGQDELLALLTVKEWKLISRHPGDNIGLLKIL